MKKIFSVFLSMMLILSITACGSSKDSVKSGDVDSSPESSVDNSIDNTSEETEDPVVIKLGYTHGDLLPEESDEVTYAKTFKEYVEANSDSIKVELYPSDMLGSANDVVGAITAGTVQMGIYEIAMLNNYKPETMVFTLPGAFRNFDEVNGILDSEWTKGVFEEAAAETKLRVLGGTCKGLRCFTAKGYELRTVEDAKGVTFRVMDSPLYVKMVEAISANPVPMPGSEMYVAMQNGVVDGQENPVTNILNDRTNEVQDWLVLDNHSPCIVLYYINDDFYQGLTNSQKSVIDEANELAMGKARNVISDLTNNAITKLEASGMTVYEPTEEELQGWHDAYGPVCEEYMRDQIGDKIVDEFLNELAAYRK